MNRRHSGILLRINPATACGYLASADRRRTHPFHFAQVHGYVSGEPFPIPVGAPVQYRVEGLRITEVLQNQPAEDAGPRAGAEPVQHLPAHPKFNRHIQPPQHRFKAL